MPAKKSAAKAMPAEGKDPQGGLTAEGRKFLKERDGSNLKPGVKGAADTPEKMKRKGSFLTRHFTNPRGPMVKDGEPTRLALSAQAWGEPVPKTEAAAKKLAAKGRKLLEEFHAATGTKAAGKKASGKKAATQVTGKSAHKRATAEKVAKRAAGKKAGKKAVGSKVANKATAKKADAATE